MIDASDHSAVTVCDECGGCRGIYLDRAEARAALAAHEALSHPGTYRVRNANAIATRRAETHGTGNVSGR